MNTHELIEMLSKEPAKPKLAAPQYYAMRLLLLLLVYAGVTQWVLGLRPDLMVQLRQPLFVMEVLLLAVLTGVSAWSAVLSMYPDRYQKRNGLNLPYFVFVVLVCFMLLQLLVLSAPFRVPSPEEMECALCIASVAMVPAALLFVLLRKGASLHPWRSGSFAVLAAAGIGCFTLRLAEANDAVDHFVIWHYLPTLLFAALGACVGKYFLRW